MFDIIIHLSPQTCGLCYGQTPDPSLTCYDQIGEEQCRGLADKCFQYKGVCKKVRSWMLLRSRAGGGPGTFFSTHGNHLP